MNITIQDKKKKAIEILQRMDIYKPYIEGFRDNSNVCSYENFGGYWVY